MIDDDGYVLVTFFISGLINTDIYKVVEPAGAIGFDIIQGAVYASADGLPVDAHVFGYDTAWQVNGEPSYCEIKVLCETAVWVCPRYIGNKHAMFRALDAMRIVCNINEHCSPV